MSSSYATCTKEKTISYEQRLFIKRSLRQLGLNAKMEGFSYLQKSIIYAYKQDLIVINYQHICNHISQNSTQSAKTIDNVIRYSINNLNTKKLSTNYELIFGIEFSYSDFNIASLISDFKDILEEMESI